LARDREEWGAVCDRGLATFEQQHIDVAVAKRARRHQRQRGRDPPVQYAAVFAPQPLEPHAPTQRNALSSVIVEPTDN